MESAKRARVAAHRDSAPGAQSICWIESCSRVEFVELPLGRAGVKVRHTLASQRGGARRHEQLEPSISMRGSSERRHASSQRMPKVSAASIEDWVSYWFTPSTANALRPRRTTPRA